MNTTTMACADSFFSEKEKILARVTDHYIEMRTGPGRSFPVFYIAERGDTIEILKQRTNWYKVRTQTRTISSEGKDNNQQGWVHVEQMSRLLNTNGELIDLNHPQLEDFSQRDWEGGIIIGSFGSTDEITLYSGYHFTENLSVELAVSESFGNVSNGKSANINVVHQPFPHLRYSPFITLGGGVRKTEPKSNLVSTEDRTDATVNVGAGLRIYLTQRLLLRLQYKNHVVLTSRDDDEEVEEWKIGLSAFF
ncbi:MAG: SH3 domain-containing protein [Spongiibacteraceae bacterium]|nr:SH3 domain-containing protein [Spongiibacteraceae bacterium]